jgi:hypothetical protein
MSKPAIVFALYRPNAGKDAELLELVRRHCPTLRKYELITDRAPVICRSENGTIIEVFEWVSDDAHKRVHELPEIAAIWERMAQIGDMPALGSLPEAKHTFPHFTPL